MKKQLKFQKKVCYIALLASAIAFFFSLGLLTDLYNLMFATTVKGREIFNDIQPFNRAMVRDCILMIVMVVFLFITRTHIRRRYYISNYIAVAAASLISSFLAIYDITQILNFKRRFLTEVDFEKWLEMRELIEDFPYTESTLWFDLNVITLSLVIVASLLLVGNLIWKINLMKFEDKLLSGEIKPRNLPGEV